MDFSFFNAVLRSVYFPPENPWFSGHYLNYYYYGYVIAAIPTKLLGILPSIAYNLILPAWFAMSGIGAFCIAANIVSGFSPREEETDTDPTTKVSLRHTIFSVPGRSYLAGVIALVVVMFLGNLYEVRVLWNYLPEAATVDWDLASPIGHAGAVMEGAAHVLSGTTDLPGEKGRWYFEASRPILHDGPDTPIAEFPYFTFLYGDLHPHLLTMPFYALALAWILSILLLSFYQQQWWDRMFQIFAAGLIFGVFRPAHTWDFPTFLGLGILVILWDVWRNRTGDIRRLIQQAGFYAVAMAAAAILLYWPFAQWFRTEYLSVEPWMGARTPLVDFLFVFGLSLFILLSAIIQELAPVAGRLFRGWVSSPLREQTKLFLWTVGVITAIVVCWVLGIHVFALGLPVLALLLYLIFRKSDGSDLSRITWILFAVGLTLAMVVEVMVLKGDVGRSNMVFRFYMEAWLFLGLAASVAVVSLLPRIPRWPYRLRWIWITIFILLIFSAASYPLLATNKKMADRWPNIPNPPHTLDGAAFLLGDSVDANIPAIYNDEDRPINLSRDEPAIRYLQEHAVGSPVIVEGHTTEYRWGSRFSIYTGLPSVIGWSWHVRQHNSLLDGSLIDRRIDEVNNFYNSADSVEAAHFLARYHVRYIILGDLERAYYSAEGVAKFQEMVQQGGLRIVYGDNTNQTTTIFEVRGE